MTQARRATIASWILSLHTSPTRCWLLVAHILLKPMQVLIALSNTRALRKCEKLKMAAEILDQRATALIPELRQLAQLSADRKVEVLAARTEWQKDRAALRLSVNALTTTPATALVVAGMVFPVLNCVKNKLIRRQRKLASFSIVLERIDSDTFYCELMLWFVLPGAFGDAALGDLNEEYSIRVSKDGASHAIAWYRQQARTTVKNILWRKVERLAAIGTVIDLLIRSLRK